MRTVAKEDFLGIDPVLKTWSQLGVGLFLYLHQNDVKLVIEQFGK